LTTAKGADNLWHNTPVTVTFTATDAGSGVAYTEYLLDGDGWTRGSWVTITPSRKKKSIPRVYTLYYRSVDNAGNVESTKTAMVRIS
jgi:hypothetical protein